MGNPVAEGMPTEHARTVMSGRGGRGTCDSSHLLGGRLRLDVPASVLLVLLVLLVQLVHLTNHLTPLPA